MGKKDPEAGSRHPCVENGGGGREIEAWGHIDENQKYCLSHTGYAYLPYPRELRLERGSGTYCTSL